MLYCFLIESLFLLFLYCFYYVDRFNIALFFYKVNRHVFVCLLRLYVGIDYFSSNSF